MRMGLLQEAGRDSSEENGRGPSVKKTGSRGMVLPWGVPPKEKKKV